MVIHLFGPEITMTASPARWKCVKIYVSSGQLCVEICDRETGDALVTYYTDMVMVEHSEV